MWHDHVGRPPGHRHRRERNLRAASVSRLAAAGAHVVGLDLVAGQIVIPDPDGTGESRVSVPVLACDLTDDDAVPGTVASAVSRLGGLDLLINNAGVGGPAPAELPPGRAAYRQVEVNLFAAWRTTAAAIGALEASRGRVIFVASRMAVLPYHWPPPTG